MKNYFSLKVLLSTPNTPVRVSNTDRGKTTTTRKILLSLVFCFALMSARGQYVTIPDPIFLGVLNQNGFSTCLIGNQMDTTCPAVMNATSLDFWNSNLSDATGISFFDNLEYLSCGYCQLTFLPPLPPRLKNLDILASMIDSLPTLPDSLLYLRCSYNQLTSLPVLPLFLTQLDAHLNLLDSLPPLPNSLRNLDCASNQLSFLPILPDSLRILRCDHNNLTSLPSLPDSLNYLDCGSNNITSIPVFPNTIDNLNCRFNQLTVLPALPLSLSIFNCANNQLTSLPSLPSSLINLDCSNNQLSSIPVLPSTLTDLSCLNNQISFLPLLPDSMDVLQISNNPNLTCLPHIEKINIFYWYGTNIQCMPNVISVANANPLVDLIPICEVINLNNCSTYWNIKGTTFTDTNLNCSLDSNEILHGNVKLSLIKNGNLIQQTFTGPLGEYSFDTDTGTFIYFVDTVDLPYNVNCPPTQFYSSSIAPSNQFHYDKDFSLDCKPGFDIGANSVLRTSGRFRPANYATVNVLAGDISSHYHLHCAAGVSGTVKVLINGPTSFISASPGGLTPVVSGDTLIYSIADFGTVNFQNDFSFEVQTDTTAQTGDPVCFDVTVTPLAGDNNTANNFYSHCFTVTNSFDPNEKEVSPSGSIDTSQHWLTYTIYFQNTGNDTAQFVYVLDTLDNAIDESSIQLLAYSHEPLVQVMGNVVKFNFPNINLPDSTADEPNSHGYVQYKVRIKDAAPVGTMIHNTGYIYFDFNAPVVTNTTVNQIDIITNLTPALSKGEGVVADIYPNPIASGSELRIIFNGLNVKQALLNIFDLSGRKIFVEAIHSSLQTQAVQLPLLAQGIYQCVIYYESGSSRKKLVIAGK